MEYAGIDALYKHITKKYDKDINAFIDVGSGRGKLCMYMAAHPKIKEVLGIELVKQRHEDAVHLRDLLAKEYAKKVELRNQNVLEVDFEPLREAHVFVWFSNLCFDQSTTNSIFDKLYQELPKGSILCCSKIFDTQNKINRMKEYEYIESIPIEMSWTKSSNVYIYKTV
jgi:16S rRNA A1518/A1519 N6-dimethyltransferase RsmA/KsgA/DIM1 with predicted DNA glycosylase/AP lyase activity